MSHDKALIVVDMQRAFFANDELEKKRESLTRACNKLTNYALSRNCPIFMLRTLHTRDRKTWTLNMMDDNEGYLFDGDDDAQYIDGLNTFGTIEIIKTRDSGFWQTKLLSEIRSRSITNVVICGVSTHSCVAETAIDAYNANLRVELAVEAIASHDPRYHESTLSMLRQEYRMTLLENGLFLCDV